MKAAVLGRKILRALAFSVAFALAWVPAGGLIATAAPSAQTSVESRPPPAAPMAPRKATPDEVQSYASREKKASPELERFAGGDRTVLYISGTTVVIVLLVVLIVVLL